MTQRGTQLAEAGVTISAEEASAHVPLIRSSGGFHDKPVITKVAFEQDEDTSSDRGGAYCAQDLEVETIYVDPTNKYYVLKSVRWAFNDLAELVETLKKAGVE